MKIIAGVQLFIAVLVAGIMFYLKLNQYSQDLTLREYLFSSMICLSTVYIPVSLLTPVLVLFKKNQPRG